MYAVKRPLELNNLPQPAPTPSRPQGTRVRRSSVRPSASPHRALAVETALKLTVNLGLSGVAIATLIHLIPHQVGQLAKLQELQTASKTSNERLRNVKTTFQHYFDPYQSRSIMAEQTNRVDPKEKIIVLQRPSTNSLSYQISDFGDLSRQQVQRQPVDRPAVGY
jgi:hypothetical protein